MYDRTKNTLKLKIEKTLQEFSETDSYASGFDILRWVKNGNVICSSKVDPNIFLSSYGLHIGYVILRLAKQNLLEYNEES